MNRVEERGLTGSGVSASPLASLTVDAALRACPVVMVGSDMLAEPLPVVPHTVELQRQSYRRQRELFRFGQVVITIRHKSL